MPVMVPSSIASRRVFSPTDIANAFAAISHSQIFNSGPLERFVTRRGGLEDCGHHRCHMEMPLRYLEAGRDNARHHLPRELLHVYEGLLHEAHAFIYDRLAMVGIRRDASLLANLSAKSVLRVLRYPVGVGCRPHVDPGLCTALLGGSTEGLELNVVDVAQEVDGVPGSYRYDLNSDGVNPLDELKHWQPARDFLLRGHRDREMMINDDHDVDDVLVLTGNMMEVASRGEQRSVLHRVRQDWSAGDVVRREEPKDAVADVRFNIIVELRPARPKEWYRLSATPCEV